MESICKTNNQEWGFFGTCRSNTGCSIEQAEDIWNDVGIDLIVNFGMTGEQARDFLDSKIGRHIADSMTVGNEIKGELPAWAGTSIQNFLKNA